MRSNQRLSQRYDCGAMSDCLSATIAEQSATVLALRLRSNQRQSGPSPPVFCTVPNQSAGSGHWQAGQPESNEGAAGRVILSVSLVSLRCNTVSISFRIQAFPTHLPFSSWQRCIEHTRRSLWLCGSVCRRPVPRKSVSRPISPVVRRSSYRPMPRHNRCISNRKSAKNEDGHVGGTFNYTVCRLATLSVSPSAPIRHRFARGAC